MQRCIYFFFILIEDKEMQDVQRDPTFSKHLQRFCIVIKNDEKKENQMTYSRTQSSLSNGISIVQRNTSFQKFYKANRKRNDKP